MIAVIAGTGTLPVEACKKLLDNKKSFFIVSLFPEDNESMLRKVVREQTDVVTQDCFHVGKILDILIKRKTSHVLLIGKVDKSNLFKRLKFDWLAIKLMASLVYDQSDKAVMELILSVFKKNNIEVIKQDDVLEGLLVKPGILIGALTSDQYIDISIGMKAAQAIAIADIGQTVVVKDKMIIAVEAIEGTNECIKRGIIFGHGAVTVCKTARKDQNKRYDLPTLGPSSLENISKGDISVIAWSSQYTFIAQKDNFIKRAQELGITLISVDTFLNK